MFMELYDGACVLSHMLGLKGEVKVCQADTLMFSGA